MHAFNGQHTKTDNKSNLLSPSLLRSYVTSFVDDDMRENLTFKLNYMVFLAPYHIL